jgi:phosphopantothenoylcysteine synthetase/decarboxylase
MRVLLGVSSSISAYKAPSIVSGLLATGHEVKVILTANARHFIGSGCFQAKCYCEQFVEGLGFLESIEHIDLSDWAEAFLIAPATANIIGKFANGIADDLLSTINLSMNPDAVKIMYPAMNTRMLNHPATKRNVTALRRDGWFVQGTKSGTLACGHKGEGKLADTRDIIEYINTMEDSEIRNKFVNSVGKVREE